MHPATILLESQDKVSKVGKESEFFYFIGFCCELFQSHRMASQPYGVWNRVFRIVLLSCFSWNSWTDKILWLQNLQSHQKTIAIKLCLFGIHEMNCTQGF